MSYEDVIFLGRGWAFPTHFDKRYGQVAMVSEMEDIRQSLFLLLSTIPGERLMRPEYGCNLYQLVFENFDVSTQTRAIDLVEQAILYFEPRIKVEEVTIKVEVMESIAYINIHFWIPKVNSRHNIVYPFYFKEGTNMAYQELGGA